MLNATQQTRKKAVAYYRHSAENKQENSVAIQRELTEKFALENNIEIIHEETDEGKSGLLSTRLGFERLFSNWIENSNAPKFDYVLVYDVSRWGRFQDQDEAAYFTHICTKFGKKVIYASLGFPSEENSFFSGLKLMFERQMASEYSRQLSSKVFHGCVKVSEQGYSAGGTAVYGMARQLLDVDRKPIRILKLGEHKQIANERVTFIPKDDETTAVVREIFRLFVEEKYFISEIVAQLNRKGIPSANGKRWDRSKIIKILTDETYIGTRIYNKRWGRLKQKSHSNPRSEWVVVPNAFESVIDEETFKKAKERLYWLLSNIWRGGINAVNRAKKYIRINIVQWLLSQEYSEFEAEKLVLELPIIFAIKIENSHLSQWCFLIDEKIRRFDNAFAVSVVSDRKQMLDDFFLLPVQDFTLTNYLIFSKGSSAYYSCKIENDKIEKVINFFIEELRKAWVR